MTDVTPTVKQLQGETEYLWDLEDVPAQIFEDDTPDWYDPIPRIQLSEFGSWADVVNWASPLFEVEKPLGSGLQQQIDAWKSKYSNPSDRLVAAIRFVQDDVRYLGIELGPYSHLPNQPETVYERRFGDCKDKALLLVTILRALDIEAYPALVNTEAQEAIDEWQPSPYAFNHAIAQVVLDGQTYWIDATMNLQRGGMSQYYSPGYVRALVIRPGSEALTKIPPPTLSEPTILVSSIYTVDVESPGARLDIVTTYLGQDADEMRFRLTQHSRAEVARLFLNYYASIDPGIEPDGQAEIDDDPTTNRLVISERYRIPSFWQDGKREIIAERIEEELDTPRISRRTMPLAVSFPLNVAQHVEVRLGRDPGIFDSDGTVDDGITHFAYKIKTDGGALVADFALRTLGDHVPPNLVKTHLKALEEIRKNLSIQLDENGASVTAATWVWLAIMLALVVLPLAVGLYRMRGSTAPDPLVESRPHPTPQAVDPGRRPETAVTLAGSELGQHISRLTCSCGSRYAPEGIEANKQSLTFDGKRMVVVGLACSACGEARDLYFVPAPQQ